MPIVADRNRVVFRRDRRIQPGRWKCVSSVKSAFAPCGLAERKTWAHTNSSTPLCASGRRWNTAGKNSAQVRGVLRYWVAGSHCGSGGQKPERSVRHRRRCGSCPLVCPLTPVFGCRWCPRRGHQSTQNPRTCFPEWVNFALRIRRLGVRIFSGAQVRRGAPRGTPLLGFTSGFN